MLTLAAGNARSQDCPKWGDRTAALAFLHHNQSNGTAADPACVQRAFATLSHSAANAKALVALLDFERSVEHDSFKTRAGRYPAIGALVSIGKPAAPFLIKAIKDDQTEIVRTNAAEALGDIYAPCGRGAISQLEIELAKPDTTPRQQETLREAKRRIEKFYASCGPGTPAQNYRGLTRMIAD